VALPKTKRPRLSPRRLTSSGSLAALVEEFPQPGEEEFGILFAFADPEVGEADGFVEDGQISGENDDGSLAIEAAEFAGDGQAVHVGHPVINDYSIDGLGAEQVEALAAGGGGEDVVAGRLEKQLAQQAAGLFVIDAQDCGLLTHRWPEASFRVAQ